LIGQQTTELPEHNPDLKHQVLLILNEFTALGRIPIVSESMSYLPGYNVRLLLIIQATSQLRDVYGVYTAETMLKSAAARIVFSPKDFADAKEISDDLGVTTVRVRSQSRPSPWALNGQGGRANSTTDSLQARALMLPQEVKELGTENALIFFEGLRPVKCQKIRYFADVRFRARLLPPPIRATPNARRVAPPQAHGVSAPAFAGNPVLTPDAVVNRSAATVEELGYAEPLTFENLDDRLKNLTFEHEGEHPTERELDADVDRFLEAIR
jgi:type IV secretion system protein VirD4